MYIKSIYVTPIIFLLDRTALEYNRLVQVSISRKKKIVSVWIFEEMLMKGRFTEVWAGYRYPHRMLKHQETSRRGEQVTLSLKETRRE